MANGQSRKYAGRQSSREIGRYRVCRRLRISELIWKGLQSRHGNVAGEIPLKNIAEMLTAERRYLLSCQQVSADVSPRTQQ